MTRKPERRVFAFIRRGNTLRPEMDYDLRALDGVAEGQRVKVEVKQWRNLGRLRAYWAMLSEVVDATNCAPSPEKLHEAIKLQTGHVDLVRVGNLMVAIPGSIAFDTMTEADMTAFFQQAEEFLAANYGWTKPDAA